MNKTTTNAPGLFVVFEGIDGSGKTTISNRVAQELRARGLVVEHLREGGSFASSVTQGIRDFCRDARNLALVPRAELLLYVAREAQLLEEALLPARERADIVIADRYFYTAEVLARAGRSLPDDVIKPILDAAAGGHWPDLVLLIDSDPSVARGRRKVSKILSPDRRPSSRKGLTGAGLQQRLAEGYREIAARDPSRWLKIDNTEADLEQVIATVMDAIDRARARQPLAAATIGGGGATPAPANDVAAIGDPPTALRALLEWVDRRAEHEPLLAAYVLAGMAGEGVDERRLALAARAPKVVARGLRGLSDAVSWQLRRMLVESAPQEVALSLVDQAAESPAAWELRELIAADAPNEVALSLTGLDDETAWALRDELAIHVPDAVMVSLALLDSQRAWGLRERWIAQRGGLEAALAGYFGARAAARSVTGVGGRRAWAIRKAARAAAPVPALASILGLGDDKSWQWRERALARAPKPVLSTIAGIDEERAWLMRLATAPRCREALDSMIGLDGHLAWEIRESCLDTWPSNVVKSLGVLVSGSRGEEMLRRALARTPRGISLLKQAAIVATGANLSRTVLAA